MFACREHAGEDFSPAEIALVQLLLAHLQQAVDLHSTVDQLESERRLYAAAIDRLLVGAAILDNHGHLLRCNGVAQRLLSNRDGLECRQERLYAYTRQDNRELQAAIARALRQPAGADAAEVLALKRPSGATPLHFR